MSRRCFFTRSTTWMLLTGACCLSFPKFVFSETPSAATTRTLANWPRFLNVNMDGKVGLTPHAPESFAGLNWSEPPDCDWTLALGEGYGLGVVRDGYYYHFDATKTHERLRQVDLEGGEVGWSQESELVYRDLYGYESGPRSSPTIAGDQIFTLGVAGDLIARSLKDGALQWKVSTSDEYDVVQNFFGVGSAPLVLNDQVIVMVGGSPSEDQSIAPGRLDRVSPNGSLLVAFDRETGDERWRCGDDLASYSSPTVVILGGKPYILIFARDHLHVVDPRLGRSLGQVSHRADLLESVNAMVPAVAGNRVLISDCYDVGSAVYDLRLDTGRIEFDPVWKDPVGNRRAQSLRSHMSTPLLVDRSLYACSGRNAPDSDFRCLDFDTGKVYWTALERGRSTASLLGDVMLILQEYGTLRIARCNTQKYEELGVWSLAEDGPKRPVIRFPCWSAPVVVNDRMLVRGDQRLLCLKIPDSAGK